MGQKGRRGPNLEVRRNVVPNRDSGWKRVLLQPQEGQCFQRDHSGTENGKAISARLAKCRAPRWRLKLFPLGRTDRRIARPGDERMATAARQKSLVAKTFGAPGTLGPSAALNLALSKTETTARVFVAAETELLLEMYTRMLKKDAALEVVGRDARTPFDPAALAGSGANILLLTSCGKLLEDLDVIRGVRASEPNVEIVMLGEISEEAEFLQCVRAGVRGYLARDSRSEDILRAIMQVREGAAVCPGKLCARLFRYFESEAKSLPSASVHQRLGLTRREQQLIPLVARGLTNKEIANHFSLSEQTVKNHLYRMKHKIGAQDRLSIVHVCRMQGFMV